MQLDTTELIKYREIYFCELHPENNQAGNAMLLLSDVEGVVKLHHEQEHCLHVAYDIRHLILQAIENALSEVGFHLDNHLIHKLKRALYYYSEESQRDNLGIQLSSGECTKRIFINRYMQNDHGCRDNRPDHWRRYL